MHQRKVQEETPESGTTGQLACQKNGWRFQEVFRYQFRICRKTSPATDFSGEWVKIAFSDYLVQHCPKLPVCHVSDVQGRQLAVILGVAISGEGRCLTGKEVYEDKLGDFVDWLEELSGRFIVLATVGERDRLYLDPAGNLSVVYDPGRQMIASSVHLIAENTLKPHTNVDTDLVLQNKESFVFGETSDASVIRAKPNHYLCLNDFREYRHWPREDTPFAELDKNRSECIKEIAERLSRNISALTQTFSCGLPVTAGMDSRIILACATPFLDRIKSFFCYRLNQSTLIDAEAAVRLAEQLVIPMLIISRRSPQFQRKFTRDFVDDEYEKMLARTGHCSGLRKDWVQYVAQTPPVDVVLRGTGLEMTRANKWTQENSSVPCSSINGLRALTGLRPGKRRSSSEQQRYDGLLQKYEEWMDTLPASAQERLYDLAHIELMLPSGPVLEYSAYVAHYVVNPFNDRRLYQLTAAITPQARRQKRIVRRIIAIRSKHLLNIPFHRNWGKHNSRDPA